MSSNEITINNSGNYHNNIMSNFSGNINVNEGNITVNFNMEHRPETIEIETETQDLMDGQSEIESEPVVEPNSSENIEIPTPTQEQTSKLIEKSLIVDRMSYLYKFVSQEFITETVNNYSDNALLTSSDYLEIKEIISQYNNPNTNEEIQLKINKINEYFQKNRPKFMEDHNLILVAKNESIKGDFENAGEYELLEKVFINNNPIFLQLAKDEDNNKVYTDLVAEAQNNYEAQEILKIIDDLNKIIEGPDNYDDKGLFRFNYSNEEEGIFNGFSQDIGTHHLGFFKDTVLIKTLQEIGYGTANYYGLQIYGNGWSSIFGPKKWKALLSDTIVNTLDSVPNVNQTNNIEMKIVVSSTGIWARWNGDDFLKNDYNWTDMAADLAWAAVSNTILSEIGSKIIDFLRDILIAYIMWVFQPITSEITSKVTEFLGVDYVTDTWNNFKEDIKQKAKDKVSNVF